MTNILTPEESEALLLSLRVASVAVACALPFAFATALLLARTRFTGKPSRMASALPLVLPPVAVGYLLLVTFGTRAGLGAFLLHAFGIRFVFSWTGAALAAGIVTFPFQVRAIRLSLESADRGLSEAAATLGARPFDRLFNVTLPSRFRRWWARSPPLRPASASSAPSSPSSQTSRRDAHPAACDLHRAGDAGRRDRGRTAAGAVHRAGARLHDAGRVRGPQAGARRDERRGFAQGPSRKFRARCGVRGRAPAA